MIETLHVEPTFGSFRKYHTTTVQVLNPTTGQHNQRRAQHLSIKCTLADIARATNLRVDDCRLALKESGLLLHNTFATKKDVQAGADSTGGSGGNVGDEVFFISKEGVEQVAEAWNVKRMMLDVKYIVTTG